MQYFGRFFNVFRIDETNFSVEQVQGNKKQIGNIHLYGVRPVFRPMPGHEFSEGELREIPVHMSYASSEAEKIFKYSQTLREKEIQRMRGL